MLMLKLINTGAANVVAGPVTILPGTTNYVSATNLSVRVSNTTGKITNVVTSVGTAAGVATSGTFRVQLGTLSHSGIFTAHLDSN